MVHTEIIVKGRLSADWSDWFEGMQLSEGQAGVTLLCGDLPDKSAVYGILSRLSSLGITLVSVSCVDINPRRN